MTIVKSLSVGDGDMFYIKHGTDNFTIIDCCMSDDDRDEIIKEIKSASESKGIKRFISTHPDDDHIHGLVGLDDEMKIRNFYCVKNGATKPDETDDFDRYRELRDDSRKAFYLFRECSRYWMNKSKEGRGSSGINILWPITSNKHYKEALKKAKNGESPNNISPIVKYSRKGGASIIWMGDLETDFMGSVEDAITMDAANILFAPHHGRDSGKVPKSWLNEMDPQLVIIGEAPSKHLNYYADYNTITQNSAGDITLECVEAMVHIYVSEEDYAVDFLSDEGMPDNRHGYYLGTLFL